MAKDRGGEDIPSQRDEDDVTAVRLQDLQGQVDRRIKTQQRELEDASAHIKDLISAANAVDLREYVEAVMEKSERALEMAEREREKAAVALREQTQRALDKADQEREKSASVLRSENQRALDKADIEREKAAHVLREDLASAIQTGDRNLLSHIQQEINRIREALASADKLEVSRINAAENATKSVQRELTLIQEGAKEAIEKAEVANEKRFESVNEFRNSLSDQTASFLPREVADAQFTELRKSIQANSDRITRITGNTEGQAGAKAGMQPWALWAAGAIITIVVACIIILANVLTSV